ncbi:protein sel-1 homolog 2 isoform X2 [Homo sapiens]|uniref:protein sel-1 homolog 2 isoform X2 n=1 Tax=Homo sapiens TaxID=9606 RepID=UPI0003EB068C|nr:protein sel-1 homolog 2 isoform X2 [Homo sapiens]XP_054180039.1 protein sel-1 homolog 2 isoform X2 [Homo sapiens]XP_054189238.1 protein sel-1 homolog 2 isoform X2 [Homo sapiens]|eukprot:XP_006723711.1 protein sel-1 homolog 2 isoform X3 [Homo sapiens]
MKPLSLLIEILIILGVTIKTIKAEEHNKRQKERNVTTQVSVNEIKQYLSHILEQRTSSNVINKRENLLEKKKNQRKIRIKGIQNKDILKRNKNHLQKQAEKNFTDEGDQLFKMGIKVLQQSKSQKQKEEAYLLFAKAADMGNLKAMEKMADALLFGNFGVQNITAAIQLYESLAKEGSCKAQNALGFLSSYGIGMEYDQAKALIYYTFGSAGGNMMSQMILGYRYLSGINVLQNCEVALSYYKKVADYIADTFEKSEGVPVEKVRLTERPENLSSNSEILDWDIYQYYKFLAERGDVQIQKALHYFLKAAKAGSANAMAFIGKMYLEGNAAVPQNNATAFKYFSMAASKGNAIGLHGLGLLYFHGKGVPLNYAEALKYFQKAAEKGWPDAQFQLGFMYYSGSGIWKDYKLAFKYFYLASQSGQPLAIYYLAKMYATGTGVVRSCRTAVELYKGVCELGHWAEKFLTAYFAYKDGDIDSSLVQYALLAEMGYEVAQSNSAFILESKKANILEKEKMYPMALLLWNRAAIQGNAFARVKIGDYHYYGYGTKKDYQTAATHYSIAANKYHNAQAMFNLAYMYEHGLGITKDIHLARRLYDMAAQTSPDAHIPVLFAVMKLETTHLLRDILFFNQFTTRWNWLKLDNTIGPHWDLFVIGLIVPGLILLLRNHHG